MSARADFQLARQLQAVCASAHSFLGPYPAFKMVIDTESESRNTLAGSLTALLLAASAEPTATTLLLETLEGQARYSHLQQASQQLGHSLQSASIQRWPRCRQRSRRARPTLLALAGRGWQPSVACSSANCWSWWIVRGCLTRQLARACWQPCPSAARCGTFCACRARSVPATAAVRRHA
jgi:hypothetical protein